MFKLQLSILLSLFFLINSFSIESWANPPPDNKNKAGISPKFAADYIHAVIEAGRTIYSEVIVERLGVTIDLKATENWKQENTLPLPAQFLLLSSHASNAKDIEMDYRLMSLWPINEKNGPKTKFEKMGLEKILKTPEKPFTQVVTIQGKPYFKAVYPDKAVTKACVNCHNHHPKSPKKNFKLGDIMGGISIVLPLSGDGKSTAEEDYRIPAKWSRTASILF